MRAFNEFSFLLEIETALLDAVVPELRAVTYDIDFVKLEFTMDFIFDKEIDSRLFEVASVAITEIDLPFDHCDWHPITVKISEPILFRSRCAYCRYESNLPMISKIVIHPSEKVRVPPAYLVALMNQALLGRVTPNLREVTLEVDVETKRLSIRFVYHGEISDLENQLANAAFEEGTSCYRAYNKELIITRIDYPKKCSQHGKRFAYLREENRMLLIT